VALNIGKRLTAAHLEIKCLFTIRRGQSLRGSDSNGKRAWSDGTNLCEGEDDVLNVRCFNLSFSPNAWHVLLLLNNYHLLACFLVNLAIHSYRNTKNVNYILPSQYRIQLIFHIFF
jgi:hypothetical protein